MSAHRFLNPFYVLVSFFIFGILLNGCGSQSTQPSHTSRTSEVPQLRIVNNGSFPIKDLVVRFPEDSISFGDVPVGATTEYMDFPNGVFSYAAYEFQVNGERKSQAVIDWVGENPMNGHLLTYTIDFDPGRFATNDSIRLLEVEIDS